MLINPYVFGRLWTPAEITTALWLDAADSSTITTVSGAVSQWNDKSGNGRHASQSTTSIRPTYDGSGFNGLPTVAFASSRLSFPAGFTQVSNHNIFAVLDTTNLASGYRIFLQRTSPSSFNLAIYLGGNDLAGGGISYRPFVYWDVARANWTSAIRRPAIIRWTFSSGLPASALTQVDAQTAVSETFTASQLTSWASIGDGTTQSATFKTSELVITPSTPSAANTDRIFGYLAHKWGLTANLPAGHPYKAAAPTV